MMLSAIQLQSPRAPLLPPAIAYGITPAIPAIALAIGLCSTPLIPPSGSQSRFGPGGPKRAASRKEELCVRKSDRSGQSAHSCARARFRPPGARRLSRDLSMRELAKHSEDHRSSKQSLNKLHFLEEAREPTVPSYGQAFRHRPLLIDDELGYPAKSCEPRSCDLPLVTTVPKESPGSACGWATQSLSRFR